MDFELGTRWCFDAPLDAVWRAVADGDTWPRWWPGVDSQTLDPGDARGLGARRRYVCRSALPLRLCFVTQVTRIEPQQLIEGQVEGDLLGVGRCRLTQDQGRTIVRFDWHVRTTGRWLNRLAPLAAPVLRWNHDLLMQAGGRGLARHLARRADS